MSSFSITQHRVSKDILGVCDEGPASFVYSVCLGVWEEGSAIEPWTSVGRSVCLCGFKPGRCLRKRFFWLFSGPSIKVEALTKNDANFVNCTVNVGIGGASFKGPASEKDPGLLLQT